MIHPANVNPALDKAGAPTTLTDDGRVVWVCNELARVRAELAEREPLVSPAARWLAGQDVNLVAQIMRRRDV